MYVIFDSSANGKPQSYKAPLDDLFNWPRLLHLSWILLDEDLKPVHDYDCLIAPQGFTPKADAYTQHHIDIEKVKERGVSVTEALEKFNEDVRAAEYVFAHNLNYNEGIVGSEFYRASRPSPLIAADKYCLMHEAHTIARYREREDTSGQPCRRCIAGSSSKDTRQAIMLVPML